MDSMSGTAQDAKEQIARLREQVEMLMRDRITPKLADVAGRAEQSANTPLGTVARPADIAAALLFLVSDLAAFISGQTLTVDGAVGVKFPYPMRL